MAKLVAQVGPVVLVIKDDRARLSKKTARLWAEVATDAASRIAETLGVEEEDENDG